MDKLVFSENWRQFFASQGLKSFDDFYDYPSGQIINKNNKRNVQVLTLGQAAQTRVFYMKRFHDPHFKDMLFTFCRLGRLHSQASFEWHQTNILLDNAVQTWQPVCYGQRTICGLERKSFFITAKLDGVCLTDYVSQNWSKLSPQKKEKIIIALGHAVRKVHNARISLPDLYIWHVFISEKKDSRGNCQYDFAFIDLNRAKDNAGSREYVKNLGRLDHSLHSEYFDENLRNLLIRSYAGDDWPNGIDSLAEKVRKYSRKISARRRQKAY